MFGHLVEGHSNVCSTFKKQLQDRSAHRTFLPLLLIDYYKSYKKVLQIKLVTLMDCYETCL